MTSDQSPASGNGRTNPFGQTAIVIDPAEATQLSLRAALRETALFDRILSAPDMARGLELLSASEQDGTTPALILLSADLLPDGLAALPFAMLARTVIVYGASEDPSRARPSLDTLTLTHPVTARDIEEMLKRLS